MKASNKIRYGIKCFIIREVYFKRWGGGLVPDIHMLIYRGPQVYRG